MGIRNCADIGENLQKIMTRLMANDKLVNYLYYTDADPLSQTPLTAAQKQTLIFNKLIKIIPRVGAKETAHSVIAIRVIEGRQNSENGEFKDVIISIEVFVPLTQWMIKDTNLRPFAILGEIKSSLDNKKINGLGKMTGGDFVLEFITDDVVCYEQTYRLTSYD